MANNSQWTSVVKIIAKKIKTLLPVTTKQYFFTHTRKVTATPQLVAVRIVRPPAQV